MILPFVCYIPARWNTSWTPSVLFSQCMRLNGVIEAHGSQPTLASGVVGTLSDTARAALPSCAFETGTNTSSESSLRLCLTITDR